MSTKYTGGFITKAPVAPTSSAASGIWTLDQQQQAQKAGTWPAPPVFIEDFFSTYLYTGNGSTQTITNGIDLSGQGGLVWIKSRSDAVPHSLIDTARGQNKILSSNLTDAQVTSDPGTGLTSFNSTGFSLGPSYTNGTNSNGVTNVSWTFREQPKFFDVVTWTGNGVAGRQIAHNLGSAPGCILVKSTSNAIAWQVYHRSTGATDFLVLNTTAAKQPSISPWNNTAPTSSVFTVGDGGGVNLDGAEYVAYLFAHDAGGFPVSGGGSTNGISCGSWTGNTAVNLGYEPQWVLIKRTDSTSNWFILDVMRGWTAGGILNFLLPNSSAAESTDSNPYLTINATGFAPGSDSFFQTGTFIYIAIRRGPMKTPTVGTSVFSPVARTGTNTTATVTGLNFPVDFGIFNIRSNAGYYNGVLDRLRGVTQQLVSSQTNAEVTRTGNIGVSSFASNTGLSLIADDYGFSNENGPTYIEWLFGRAPGFFDEVCYTGTGVARTVTHNLGVVPELIIVKGRNTSYGWPVYVAPVGNTSAMQLQSVSTPVVSDYWNNTTPTASVFSLGTAVNANESAKTHVAYLFATCAGVSKVGSYTGTGTTKQIDCGFTAGSRFVMIKRTDDDAGWYVWDSARGIVAGNDPYLLLNSTAAEVTNTDYVDTYNAGFEISSTAPAAINASAGTYIFLAIA
jgi:hypothetical protein